MHSAHVVQIMGRLVMIMTTDTNLATIAALGRKDPMTGGWVDGWVGGWAVEEWVVVQGRAGAARGSSTCGACCCWPHAWGPAAGSWQLLHPAGTCCPAFFSCPNHPALPLPLPCPALSCPALPLPRPALLPPSGHGEAWAPPEVKVAVPFGATLISLLCFGQAVRLAVHIGFNVRVQGVSGPGKMEDGSQGEANVVYGPGGWVGGFVWRQDQAQGPGVAVPEAPCGRPTVSRRGPCPTILPLPPPPPTKSTASAVEGVLLDDEVVVMLQRCELYFTLGLRSGWVVLPPMWASAQSGCCWCGCLLQAATCRQGAWLDGGC
jgi:hypothetical protein